MSEKKKKQRERKKGKGKKEKEEHERRKRMLSSTYGSVARLVSDILLSREDASFSFPQVKALKELTKTDEDTRLLISPMFEAAIKEIKEIDPPFDFRPRRLPPDSPSSSSFSPSLSSGASSSSPLQREKNVREGKRELNAFKEKVYEAFSKGRHADSLQEAQSMLKKTILSFLGSPSSISTLAKKYFFSKHHPFVLIGVGMLTHVSLIQILIEKGADPDAVWMRGYMQNILSHPDLRLLEMRTEQTALVYEIRIQRNIPHSITLITRLLELGADPNLYSPLSEAMFLSERDLRILFNSRNLEERSEAASDIERERLQLVKVLLRFGADPSKQRGSLSNAVELVFDATERKQYEIRKEIVTLLLESNGKPLKEQTYEMKGVMEQIEYRLMKEQYRPILDVLSLLIQNGADVNAPNLLCDAISKDQTDIVTLLLDSGVDIDALSPDSGHTALMVAARRLNEDMVELLLKRGADLEIKDGKGRTAIDVARDARERNLNQFEMCRKQKILDQECLDRLDEDVQKRFFCVEQLLLKASDLKRRKTSS